MLNGVALMSGAGWFTGKAGHHLCVLSCIDAVGEVECRLWSLGCVLYRSFDTMRFGFGGTEVGRFSAMDCGLSGGLGDLSWLADRNMSSVRYSARMWTVKFPSIAPPFCVVEIRD